MQFFRRTAEIAAVSCDRDACCGDDLLEFSRISGPGMFEKHCLCATREVGNTFSPGVTIFLE